MAMQVLGSAAYPRKCIPTDRGQFREKRICVRPPEMFIFILLTPLINLLNIFYLREIQITIS